MAALRKINPHTRAPEGTYFVYFPLEGVTTDSDIEYCQTLMIKKKVATIPPSVFYTRSDEGKRYLRFCFSKSDAVLDEGISNLLKN